jgi:fumarate reductase subunit D
LKHNRLGAGGWVAILAMLGFLAWAIWYAIHGWNSMQGVQMSALGWVFLGLGVVVTALVGGGLMALLFYSSRNDYDR